MYKKGKNKSPFDLYGPYIRKNKNDKWHSSKSCSNYPVNPEVEIKYFSTYPGTSELCPECIQLEEKNIKFT
ncbi:MAG: hypothetical protein EHM58_06500 [Ignavibacteriae bacterium]|nr:MAG: hypothetical protein EHM58_06500 [Ignavibacteriota bacterium]